MNLKETKYDAFISYRHSELDKYVAETLHRQLEMFRLPKSILKRQKLSRKRIERVFRDRDELPLASNLAEPITEALKNSDFLIVICSPRLPQSQWCRKEIETFIAMHGRERVFAVLAEGEPSEAFPPQLQYEDIEVVNERGEKEIVRRMIEPLAADVRGKNRSEIKKKIREEVLRLAAPMFELNYDDLKQRHREQRMKRIVGFTAAIAGVFLAFGAVSTTLALRINHQSKLIEQQNVEISAKNDEITAQAEQIALQYTESQKDYARAMASASEQMLGDGNSMAAVYTAMSVLPENLEQSEMPYTPEAEYALSRALYTYTAGGNFLPYDVYDAECELNFYKFSEDGSRMLLADSIDRATIWDLDTHEKVAQIPCSSLIMSSDAAFKDKDHILYKGSGGLMEYDIVNQTERMISENFSGIAVYPEHNKYIVCGWNIVECRDLQNDEVLFEMDLPENHIHDAEIMYITDDGAYIIIGTESDDNCYLSVYRGDNGEFVKMIQITEGTIKSVTEAAGKLFVITNATKNFISMEGWCTCIDLASLDAIWSRVCIDKYIYKGIYCESEGQERFIIQTYYNLISLDANTGEELFSHQSAIEILNMFMPEDSESVFYMSEDGSLFFYNIFTGVNADMSYFIESPNNRLGDFYWKKGIIFLFPRNSTDILEYRIMENGSAEPIVKIDYAAPMVISPQGTTYLENHTRDGLATKSMQLKDINTQEVIQSFEAQKDVAEFCYVGDGSEAVAFIDNSCKIYSVKDGSLIRELKLDDEDDYFSSRFSPSGKMLIISKGVQNGVRAYSLETGEILIKTPDCEKGTSFSNVYFAETADKLACRDEDKNEFRFYHIGEEQPYQTANLNLGNVNAMTFTSDGKYFVTLTKDYSLVFYDAETLGEVKTFYDIQAATIDGITYYEGIGRYIVDIASGAYMLDENLNIVAEIWSYSSFIVAENKFVVNVSREAMKIPYFTYEELLQKGEERIEGFELSEKLKKEYNVK